MPNADVRSPDDPRDHVPRKSACVGASRVAQRARLRAMTAVERIELALQLGRMNITLDTMVRTADGDFSCGFVHLRCGCCQHDLLVDFSCKNRGLCTTLRTTALAREDVRR